MELDREEIVTIDNPLGISNELMAALERASKAQLAYEIPVDLS